MRATRDRHVQGVAARQGTYLFSESFNSLERARVREVRTFEDRCLRWGRGTAEDLYASPTLLWGINEKPRLRSFWAVGANNAFGFTPPLFGPLHANCDEG